MHKLISFITGLLFSVSASAQTVIRKAETESTPFMEKNDKIYVVLAVCLVVLTGIFIFIKSLEKRISRLEKQKE